MKPNMVESSVEHYSRLTKVQFLNRKLVPGTELEEEQEGSRLVEFIMPDKLDSYIDLKGMKWNQKKRSLKANIGSGHIPVDDIW